MPAAEQALFLAAEQHDAKVVAAGVILERAQSLIDYALASSSAPGAGADAVLVVDQIQMSRHQHHAARGRSRAVAARQHVLAPFAVDGDGLPRRGVTE